MKKIFALFLIIIVNFALNADPLYDKTVLPSSGSTLAEVPVVFTVPSDVMLAFSTESTIIVDPGTIDLQIATKIEDGSFFIEHDDLYALWEIDTKSSAFEVYLYLDGPLTGEKTGNKLHWTVAGGHSIIGGGEGKYCDSPESLSSSNSIEIAEKQKKNHVQLTIDFDIDELIKAGSIEDDTYTGSIYMYYKEEG